MAPSPAAAKEASGQRTSPMMPVSPPQSASAQQRGLHRSHSGSSSGGSAGGHANGGGNGNANGAAKADGGSAVGEGVIGNNTGAAADVGAVDKPLAMPAEGGAASADGLLVFAPAQAPTQLPGAPACAAMLSNLVSPFEAAGAGPFLVLQPAGTARLKYLECRTFHGRLQVRCESVQKERWVSRSVVRDLIQAARRKAAAGAAERVPHYSSIRKQRRTRGHAQRSSCDAAGTRHLSKDGVAGVAGGAPPGTSLLTGLEGGLAAKEGAPPPTASQLELAQGTLNGAGRRRAHLISFLDCCGVWSTMGMHHGMHEQTGHRDVMDCVSGC